ncbi:Hypothetical predicted protein [Pelobates cultripes]|uniref:Uncharacterized protein n=1 Tax=Pelobates cultripes TaxID=61616 RepID=A0AAD1S2Z2_PELCU|nr:Hypothetical predicted protein [Pelobates cultripes]
MKTSKKAEIDAKIKENVVTSGTIFIIKFADILNANNSSPEVISHYMQRVLHSIFFIGYVSKPRVYPEEFIPEKILESFKEKFPGPFKDYLSHVPHQTPYSILLEFMSENKNCNEPKILMQELWEINKSLWKTDTNIGYQPVANDFTATVIAYSCYGDINGNNNVNSAYGSSISCKGRVPRRIMIHISVLQVWDLAISYAVCQEGDSPALVFPNQVCCKAYNFHCNSNCFLEVPPCAKCMKSFRGVKFNPPCENPDDDPTWPYGNCAENESLNKLLKGCQDLRSRILTEKNIQGKQMDIIEIETMFKKEKEEKLKKNLKNLLGSQNITLRKDNRKLQSFQPM